MFGKRREQMKIVEIKGFDPEDYRSYLGIKVDGKIETSFCDGEHEDNNLSRNFSGCKGIVRLMKMAHEAGKRGEELEIEQIEKKWEDLWDE
jgi:hypothetical protein